METHIFAIINIFIPKKDTNLWNFFYKTMTIGFVWLLVTNLVLPLAHGQINIPNYQSQDFEDERLDISLGTNLTQILNNSTPAQLQEISFKDFPTEVVYDALNNLTPNELAIVLSKLNSANLDIFSEMDRSLLSDILGKLSIDDMAIALNYQIYPSNDEYAINLIEFLPKNQSSKIFTNMTYQDLVRGMSKLSSFDTEYALSFLPQSYLENIITTVPSEYIKTNFTDNLVVALISNMSQNDFSSTEYIKEPRTIILKLLEGRSDSEIALLLSATLDHPYVTGNSVSFVLDMLPVQLRASLVSHIASNMCGYLSFCYAPGPLDELGNSLDFVSILNKMIIETNVEDLSQLYLDLYDPNDVNKAMLGIPEDKKNFILINILKET